MKRRWRIAGVTFAMLLAISTSNSASAVDGDVPSEHLLDRLLLRTAPVDGQKTAHAPKFIVDPGWPRSLPNKWIVGQVGGIAVDRHDNIWILQRARTLTSDEAGATKAESTNAQGEPIDALGDPRPFGPIADCCLPAPAVMQFDREGNLLQAWGGPADPGFIGGRCREEDGCVWHATEHGLYVDHNDNVYIAGNGNGQGGFPWAATHGEDSHVLKFSNDGTFLLRIGDPGFAGPANSNDTGSASNGTPQLYNPADSEVDPETNLLYIADGYGNHRIVVVDADTGEYQAHWGAYGQNPVNDAASDAAGPYAEDRDAGVIPSFYRNPVHCVRIAKDGLVYVCDRTNDRFQVFEKNKVGAQCSNPTGQSGTCGYVAEMQVRPSTLGSGSVWDLDTSSDKDQSCLYNADGTNMHVDIIDRQELAIVTTFGRHGRNAGEFHWVHNLATDSEGNLYTAEVDTGKRVQKFIRHGSRGCS
jgi:hypothetical protein